MDLESCSHSYFVEGLFDQEELSSLHLLELGFHNLGCRLEDLDLGSQEEVHLEDCHFDSLEEDPDYRLDNLEVDHRPNSPEEDLGLEDLDLDCLGVDRPNFEEVVHNQLVEGVDQLVEEVVLRQEERIGEEVLGRWEEVGPVCLEEVLAIRLEEVLENQVADRQPIRLGDLFD